MLKRILLSTAMLFALATTSWAQESGCSSCAANSGEYTGEYSGEYADDGAYSEAIESRGCASGTCGVGQDYFSTGGCGECGCGGGADYKYARLFGGLGYVDDVPFINFDDGWGAGGALGRRVGRRRTELELSYRHNSFDVFPLASGNLSTTALMANMMFDILKIGKSNVYAGGGLGIAYGDAHIVTAPGFDVDDEAFAYQGIVGIERDIRNGMKGFVEYRYLDADFNFPGSVNYAAQNLFFGVEFRR